MNPSSAAVVVLEGEAPKGKQSYFTVATLEVQKV